MEPDEKNDLYEYLSSIPYEELNEEGRRVLEETRRELEAIALDDVARTSE